MENYENGNGNGFGTVNMAETPSSFTPAGVPEKISTWTKVRNFLFHDIVVTMTPKQEKVLQEVHDFWHQEVTGQKIHDFLFQEIKIVDNITL